MALSAFRSTTKRSAVGGRKESGSAYTGVVPFQPSTPVSKRSHRRTQSFSDFNDATNSIHLDSLFQQGKRASSVYQSDCDSGSDADSMYSRHTYRNMQKFELGASRKALLQVPREKKDTRRSPSVERSYKEIADFLSCIDDPNDADAEGTPRRPRRLSSGAIRVVDDAQSDSESVFSRLAQPRGNGDAQNENETESLFSHFDRARRIVDAQSDTDSVFTRLAQPRRRVDAQSDTESVFSRLARPRSSAGLGPSRTGASTQNQNGKAKGTRAGALRRSTSQVDLYGFARGRDNDQSESESVYSIRTERSGRHTANFGQSSTVAARKKGTRQGSLRRSTSQIDFSDNASLDGFMLPSRAQDDEGSPAEAFFEMENDFGSRDEDIPCGHPEEEKTIRAVHTQNKEPGAQELDAISLYDAMRAEMRKAVSEIRSELEQKSVSKDLLLSTPSLEEALRSTGPKEDDEASVSEVRQEYAVKLEQSEKRAQDLWTQLAAEERRCLDLVKFVKELLPAQAGAALQPRLPPPPPLRPMMGPEIEQQLVSQCLDADAQRYFDECVSIAGLDIVSINDASSLGAGYHGSVGYQESESGWSVKDMPLSPRKKNFGRADERNVVFLQPLKVFCAKIEQNGKCTGKSSTFVTKAPMNEDGLVLPWLQWETKVDYAFQEHTGGVKGNLTASSSRSKSRSASYHSEEEQDTQLLDFPAGISGLGCLGNGDLSSCTSFVFGHLRTGDSSYRIDVETFVLQRSLLRHRIMGGRILICGGIRY